MILHQRFPDYDRLAVAPFMSLIRLPVAPAQAAKPLDQALTMPDPYLLAEPQTGHPDAAVDQAVDPAVLLEILGRRRSSFTAYSWISRAASPRRCGCRMRCTPWRRIRPTMMAGSASRRTSGSGTPD